MQRPEPSTSDKDAEVPEEEEGEKEEEELSDGEPTMEDDMDATQLPPGFSQSAVQDYSLDELPTLDVGADDGAHQRGEEIPFFDHMTSDDYVLEDTQGTVVLETQDADDDEEAEAEAPEEHSSHSQSSAEPLEETSLRLEYSTVVNTEENSENPMRSLSALASLSRNDKNEESYEVPEGLSEEHEESEQRARSFSSSDEEEEERVQVEISPPKASAEKSVPKTSARKARKKTVASTSSPQVKGRKQKINTAVHKNTKRLIDIRSIMERMNYKALRVTGEARKAISDAIKFFATKIICGLQDSQTSKENQAKTIKDRDVIHFISTLIPSGPVGARIQNAVLRAVSTRREFVEGSRSQVKVSESKKAGLCISRAMVKNMCDVHAPMTTFFKPSYICIAACLEQMTREIIQRCVGVVLKDTNDFDSIEEVPITRMHTTIELYHVNMALHYAAGIDTIRAYSSNPLFAHRKLDYDEELQGELKKKRNVGRAKMPIKRRVRKSVKDHNSIGLMHPEEIIYHMTVDNVIPMLFSDMKFSSAALIPNVRFGMLPDYMVDKYSGRVTGEAYMRNHPESIRMLEFLAQTYYHDAERGTQWKRTLE
jgi:hypothetical protein